MIQIPKTIEAAKVTLDGVNALLTAKQWERAAIVYAFAEPSPGRRSDLGGNPPRLTYTEFAEFGITGLSDRHQIGTYRNAWQAAIDAKKAEPVQPGDTIEVPDLPWKDFYGSDSDKTPAVQERVARQVLRDRPEVVADVIPAAVAKVIQTVPEAGGQIADVVADSRIGAAVHGRMVEKYEAEREKRETKESYERPAVRAIEKVVDAINHFYDTQMTVQGEQRTYREIIQFTLDNADLVMQHHAIPTANVRESLLRALESMRIETANLLDKLALTAGEAQE